jgi:hypothetical protein
MKGQAAREVGSLPDRRRGSSSPGNADLTAGAQDRGPPPNLAQNLTGTVQAESRNGYVKKFALHRQHPVHAQPRLGEQDGGGRIPLSQHDGEGTLQGGKFVLEEGFFDSSAVRLARTATSISRARVRSSRCW